MNRTAYHRIFLGLAFLLPAAGATTACADADQVTVYEYDTKMQLQREYTFDSGGGPTHSVTSYRYDELGRQTLIRRDANANLTESDQNDHITLYAYDVAGRLSKLIQKGGNNSTLTASQTGDIVTTYVYDALNRRTETGDAAGGKTLYEYDDSGNVTKQRLLLVSGVYADTLTEYDGLNRATKITDPEGHYREISYNSRSLQYLEVAKSSGGTALARRRWFYDNVSRLTKEAALLDPTNTGNPDAAVDRTADYVYDADGRMLTQTTYNANSSDPLRTVSAYDVNGWLTRTTDPIGGYVQNLYNATGTVTQRYVYDVMGTRTINLDYDGLVRLTQETWVGSANRVWTYDYDGVDRRISATDPEGQETVYTYNGLGRQDSIIEDNGGLARETAFVYERIGWLKKLTAHDDDDNEDQETVYEYDLAGRRTKIKYPDTTGANDTVRYAYDLAGRMTQRQTPDNVFTVTYAYDKRGLLTQKDDGATYERYAYDGAGRMLSAKKGTSGNDDALSGTTFAYDGLSRLTQEAQALLEGAAKTLAYDYDQAGNRLTLDFEAGGVNSLMLAYDYDDLSQNTNIQARYTTAGGAPTGLQNLVDYEYQGRFLTKRSVQTRYRYESTYATKDLFLHYRPEYDGQRFVTKVTNATRWGVGAGGDHDELARFDYAFDAAGNRLSNAGHRGSGGNAEGFSKIQNIDAYQHDGLHRLTKVDYNMSATTGDEIYVYDSLGNRVTYTDQRNATTRTYANNVANEYTSVAAFAVTHDAAGNLSKQVVNGDGDSYQYTYDCDNRLLGVAFEEAGVGATPLATFAYDALGRKITAWTRFDGTGDSQTADLRFYHDGQVEIADYHSDGTLARRFVNGTQYIDERVALIEGEADEAETFYYLLQELFTVTGLVEKNGALAEADVYDGYGKVRLWDYSPGDFDRDGDVDATDQTTFTTAMGLGAPGTPTPDPSTDLDMDGDTDLTDAGLFNTIKNSGGAVAERYTSSLGNPFHFTGRRLYMLETLPEADATPVANQQLQHNRARHYSPLEGRWLQRDPLVEFSSSWLIASGRHPLDTQGMHATPATKWPNLRAALALSKVALLRNRPEDPISATDYALWTLDGMNPLLYCLSSPISQLDPYGLCSPRGASCYMVEHKVVVGYSCKGDDFDLAVWLSLAEALAACRFAKPVDPQFPLPGGLIPSPTPGPGDATIACADLLTSLKKGNQFSVCYRYKCKVCGCGWLPIWKSAGGWTDWLKCSLVLDGLGGVQPPGSGFHGMPDDLAQQLITGCLNRDEAIAQQNCNSKKKCP
ncbi:MAG: hypothetical protein FLDDKLPJ_03317 [Phycisphaerae bacterium]|nr:hypothetical protein [Phycisphaerae bacterium]